MLNKLTCYTINCSYFLLLSFIVLQNKCHASGPPEVTPYDMDPEQWEKDPLKAFNNKIQWIEDVEDGLELAKKLKKPLFLLVHRAWCHACHHLSATFRDDEEIEILSKHFVMVNAHEEGQPWQEDLQPDGKYIPRVHFIRPDGSMIFDAVNPDKPHPTHKFLHTQSKTVSRAMKNVLKWFGNDKIETELEEELKLRHASGKNQTDPSSESKSTLDGEPKTKPEPPGAKADIPDLKPMPDKKVSEKEPLKPKSEL